MSSNQETNRDKVLRREVVKVADSRLSEMQAQAISGEGVSENEYHWHWAAIVNELIARRADETTSLTEAEELLKAWTDPLPPNGRLYWAHVEKAREYFRKRLAVEPRATLGIKVVVDPSMPPDEIVMRGANGQSVRVTGLAIPDKASANTAICKTCCQEFELHDGHKCLGLAENASGEPR